MPNMLKTPKHRIPYDIKGNYKSIFSKIKNNRNIVMPTEVCGEVLHEKNCC